MPDEKLLRLPLHEAHAALGAEFGTQAGWQVPLSYGDAPGEAAAAAERAGVFDLSHLGRIRIRGDGATDLLERLCTSDVARQEDDTSAYTLLLNERGGILADGLLVRAASFWLLTCGACNRAKVLEHLGEHAGRFDVKLDDQTQRTVMLAAAGPAAPAALDAVLPVGPSAMPRGAVKVGSMLIARYLAMRTGCTRRWSLEVILPNMVASQAWRFVTERAGENRIAPAGLAARDVLRIEAGLPRYGCEIDETTDPVTAGLERAVNLDHEFIGRDAVAKVRAEGPSRKLVGLAFAGGPDAAEVPAGAAAVLRADGSPAGEVTSAARSPSLGVIAMANVAADVARPGEALCVDVGGPPQPAEIVPLPFRPAAR